MLRQHLPSPTWGSSCTIFRRLVFWCRDGLGVLACHHHPPTYRAEVLIQSVTEDSKSRAGRLASGGLAAMVGLSVDGGSRASHLAVFQSRSFIEDCLREEKLLPLLFHSRWDSGA